MIDKSKLVLVVGGYGTVGTGFTEYLYDNVYNYIKSDKVDLNLFHYDNIVHFLLTYKPVFIVNLAAVRTNIQMNREKPFSIYSDTVLMNTNLYKAITAIPHYKPEKILSVVSSCAYTDSGDSGLQEANFDKGRTHSSVEPHGYAKRNLYYLSNFVRSEFGINSTCVTLNNIYGGENWSKPASFKVLSSLVKKFVDARNANSPSVELWGSGKARREFIHRDDAVKGIFKVLESDFNENLINIGCGYDISIKDLSEGIKLATRYRGDIVWNTDMPDGQIRKLLSNEMMRELIEWTPEISLADGIDRTILSYEKHLEEISNEGK